MNLKLGLFSVSLILLITFVFVFKIPKPVTFATSLSFLPPVSYQVKDNVNRTNPQSVISVDLNGDNHQDLVATDYESNTVNIRHGLGNGTFGPSSSYGTGVQPNVVLARDVNNDGKQDLIVLNYLRSFSVLLGNGDGTFGAQQQYTIGGAYVMTITDINNDAKQDVIITNSNNNSFSSFLGNGDGTFQGGINTPTGSGPYSIGYGDFNVDGKPDIVVTSTSGQPGSVSIHLGNGNGTFLPRTSATVGGFPNSVTVGDFNKDGKPDIAVANSGDIPGDVSVLLGNGNGTFQQHTTYISGGSQPQGTGSEPLTIINGDLDSDSNLDLIITNYFSNDFTVLGGNGDGTFQSHQDFQPGNNPVAVGLGDFNEDNKPDLVVSRFVQTGTLFGSLSVMLQGSLNHAPVINPISDATILEGGTYSVAGGFSDSDSVSWEATVDYGDGGGSVSLPLNGTNFTLNHTYIQDGQYPLSVTVQDNQGAISTESATITVNNASPTVGNITISTNPVPTNTQVTAIVSFTDPGILDTHAASWDWGDGTVNSGTITESNGAGTASNSHTYAQTGVYTVIVSVTDNQNGNGTAALQYLVVYDVSAGFLTASGKYNSEAGWYVLNNSSGEVKLGVQAKYVSSNTTPTGDLKFKFNAANLEFDSTSYDWLVVNGAKAILKDAGQLNGNGEYNFLLSGIDGSQAGGNNFVRFQIKDSNGSVVYDTQLNATDTVDPVVPLTSGSVKVH